MLALFLINMFACSRWWRSNRRINDISERRSNGGSTEQHTTQARRETATHRKGEDTNGDGCEQAKATVRPTGFSTGCYEGELFVLKKYTCGRLTRNSIDLVKEKTILLVDVIFPTLIRCCCCFINIWNLL